MLGMLLDVVVVDVGSVDLCAGDILALRRVVCMLLSTV